jgi:hypothetical protein
MQIRITRHWSSSVYLDLFAALLDFFLVRRGGSGYMSPEYAMDGMVSFMQDVYSFGVLLLEIVSGRRNQRSFNLIAHVSNQVTPATENKILIKINLVCHLHNLGFGVNLLSSVEFKF